MVGKLVPDGAFPRCEGLGGDPPRLHGGQQGRHQGVVKPAGPDDGARQLTDTARQRRPLERRAWLQMGVLCTALSASYAADKSSASAPREKVAHVQSLSRGEKQQSPVYGQYA